MNHFHWHNLHLYPLSYLLLTCPQFGLELLDIWQEFALWSCEASGTKGWLGQQLPYHPFHAQ